MGIIKKLFSSLIWGNLLAMVLVVVFAVVGAWYFLAIYTHHDEAIDVPNVVGHQQSDARYQLETMGLKATVVDSAYKKDQPAGCVLDQIPQSGQKVKSGREIFLTVNAGSSPTKPLPDIADNSSLREAQARLKAMGFKLGPVEYVEGDPDWVYGVRSGGRLVMSGERVPLDVPIVLEVGKGEEEELEDFDMLDGSTEDPAMELDDPTVISPE